jgi:hypothetical protein
MARTDKFTGTTMFCVVCQKPVPETRQWSAITCSKECSRARKDFARSHQDQTECRYCRRPATPEERARYQAWRRWEKAGIGEEQSSAKLLRENQRLAEKLARAIERIEAFGGDV